MNHQQHFFNEHRKNTTRRWFFKECGVGLGAIALNSLLARSLFADSSRPTLTNPLAPKQPHFAPKAKRVIFLFMAGAPSHPQLFDHKTQLTKINGQPSPAAL